MDIRDFFDEEHIEHIRAYKHLVNTGTWPEGFVPKDVMFESGWKETITAKLANKFVENKLARREGIDMKVKINDVLIDDLAECKQTSCKHRCGCIAHKEGEGTVQDVPILPDLLIKPKKDEEGYVYDVICTSFELEEV